MPQSIPDMARMLTLIADRVPLGKGSLYPNTMSEGGNPYEGGSAPLSYAPETTSLPLTEFTNGNIRATQTTVDARGVSKYMKRIRAGEDVGPVEIAPDKLSGQGNWRIVDGHTRLRAMYDLGIKDIPVSVKAK